MTNEEELAAVQAKAEALLAGRLAVVDELAGAEHADRAAEQAAQRARAHKAAVWAKAEKAGWSEAELVQMGFKKPTTRAPGRPRGKKKAAESTGASATRAPSPRQSDDTTENKTPTTAPSE